MTKPSPSPAKTIAKRDRAIRVDVIVVGGGPAGLTTAVALGDAGLTVASIDRESIDTRVSGTFDGRTTAITFGSANVLRGIGAWDGMADHAEPVLATHVVDRGSPVCLHVGQEDIGDHPYGYNIENGHIRTGLIERMRCLDTMIDLSPASVETIAHLPGDDGVEVVLGDGRRVHGALLVGSDGRGSQVREWAGIKVRRWRYDQTALVFAIHHDRPHGNVAVEHLMDGGPFAIVPMTPRPEDGGNRSAIVWCESRAVAERYLRLPADRFDAEVQWRTQGRLGKVQQVGQRFAYPISGLHARSYIAHRVALTGEAAHAVHPIAAQGLNLSIRDAAALAEVVSEAVTLGRGAGDPRALERYQRWRRFDTMQVITYTDTFLRTFRSRSRIVGLARNAVLAAINAAPPLKRSIIRDAMGLAGHPPALVRGVYSKSAVSSE